MKALCAIRFDASDERVFACVAGPGEWVVSGASTFQGVAAADLTGKLRQAFANGFLGTSSLGHTTFAVVATADDRALDEARSALAAGLAGRLGAPGAVAVAIAAEEVAYARDVCDSLPVGTVLAVARRRTEDGGICEQLRRIERPPVITAATRAADGADTSHARIWTILDDDD